jgi:AcrR family transcriptional regulator
LNDYRKKDLVEAAPIEARPARSSGRPRSRRAHDAIIEATVELLAAVGYSEMSIEAIAERAGVGKSTIYRWWPSKGALAGEALAQGLNRGPEEPTGSTRQDLIRTLEVTIGNYSDTTAAMSILPALVAHIERDPELLDSFRHSFLEPRRRNGRLLIQHAVERGDLPDDVDPDLLMDIWAGAIFYRSLVSGGSLEGVSEQLTDLILAGRLPRRR